MYDEHWAEVSREAEEKIKKLDTEIAKRCRALGIPEAFRPQLSVDWYGRGENATKERRRELRVAAVSELQARAQKAKCVIDQAEAEVLTQLTAQGLTTEAARTFLETMPSVEKLMPKLQLADLEKRRPLLSVGPEE